MTEQRHHISGTDGPTPSTAPAADARIPTLDGLRGLAILLVMNLHFAYFALHGPGLFGRSHTVAVDRIWLRITGAGWSGVDLFFVVSGFLITGILHDSRERAGRYFRTFYARRALRIFPVYYTLLISLMLFVPWILPAQRPTLNALVDHRFWYYTYTLNFRPLFGPVTTADFNLTGHLWSLAVEEQFYLVWPALVLLLAPRRLMWACLAAMVAAPLLRVTLQRSGSDPLVPYIFTPARADSLAVGAAIALFSRSPGGLERLGRFAGPVALVTGIITVGLYFARDGLSFLDAWVQTLGFSALAFFWGALLVKVLVAAPGSSLTAAFRGSVPRWFGRYSYALYLTHVPVAMLLARRVDIPASVFTVWGSLLPGAVAFWAVAGGISAAVAFLSWNLIEKQFLSLKSAFPYARRARDDQWS